VAKDRGKSPLIVAELFDSGDDAFLGALLEQRSDFKPVLAIVEKFKRDPRPWAAQMRLKFARFRGLQYAAKVVYKRLFKHARAIKDDELMASFLVNTDRQIRRKRGKRFVVEQSSGRMTRVEVLRTPSYDGLFSTRTLHYLRRSAWRYFRKLGFTDPVRYRTAISAALTQYTDADVRSGENLIDNWGLMHACFGKSPELRFDSRHTNLSAAGSLARLQAAPMFERHWQDPAATSVLLSLLLSAQCRAVRQWTIQLLKRHHQAALASIQPGLLLRLIDHDDPDVAAFASELLDSAEAVAAFPVETWLSLLSARNAAIVSRIASAFRKHVSFNRVTLAQAIDLALRPALPTAQLGIDIADYKDILTADDRALVATLAGARNEGISLRVILLAFQHLNVPGVYDVEQMIPFFDSVHRSMRRACFFLLFPNTPADMDPNLFARLFESPYDDVRLHLIARLQIRRTLPGATVNDLAPLWSSVLLNIHRGGRKKVAALQQISKHLTQFPDAARQLLPIMVVAIRSVRPPEARHGLASIVAAVERDPSLEPIVREQLPELNLDPAEARP
jgi:hypothetical protein